MCELLFNFAHLVHLILADNSFHLAIGYAAGRARRRDAITVARSAVVLAVSVGFAATIQRVICTSLSSCVAIFGRQSAGTRAGIAIAATSPAAA